MSTPQSLKKVSKVSKKIQKQKSPKTPQTPSDDGISNKKYKTATKKDKKLILADLKKGLICQLISQGHLEESIPHDVLSLIDMAHPEEYNKILTRVMQNYDNTFVASTKALTQLRKKIKNWIKGEDKDETRGGLVVAPNQLPEFLQRVSQILEALPFRSFELLQKELLQVVQEFSEKSNKTFNENTCSKHWWFNFIRAHEDIKEKWESILLERSLKKQEAKKKKQASDVESEFDSATSEGRNLVSQISSPVHEAVETEIQEFNPQMEEEKEENTNNEMNFDIDFFPTPSIIEQTNKIFIEELENADHQTFVLFGDDRDFMESSL